FRKGEDEEPLEYVPHPDPQTYLAPDGTHWTNVVPPDGRRKVINKWATCPGVQGIRKVVSAAENCKSVLDVFKLMVDDSIIDDMLKRTDKNARKILQDCNEANPDREPQEWKFTDQLKIQAFMGQILLAGVHGMRKISTKKIWRSDPKYKNQYFCSNNV
ncbi:unnamed protein product, partial [Allacma fusca]